MVLLTCLHVITLILQHNHVVEHFNAGSFYTSSENKSYNMELLNNDLKRPVRHKH